jgi:glutathione peroxidase
MCAQFGGQDPGSNSQIKAFATSNYGVTFPMMSKVRGWRACRRRLMCAFASITPCNCRVCGVHTWLQVDVNGPGAAPVFEFLKNAQGGLLGNDVSGARTVYC